MAHLSLDDARSAVLERAATLGAESVSLTRALGRITSAPVAAPFDQPPFPNSAMDGFALHAADSKGASPTQPVILGLTGESRAGEPAAGGVEPGQCARISTGAMMPEGTDCVLRVEDAVLDEDRLTLTKELRSGEDVRPAGDDVRSGDLVIPAATKIGAGEVAMLAAVGMANVQCQRRARVAILTTGDELIAPGQPLQRGEIYDSNSAMLAALVEEAGGEVVCVRAAVGDTLESTKAALSEVLGVAPDVLICCGGVSVGEHDHVKPALTGAGVREVFWHVAMRPGHPTWFGELDRAGHNALVFGLPGNPVSAYVTFQMFAAPALRKLSGRVPAAARGRAQLAEPVKKKPGNALVLRCALRRGSEGVLLASQTSANQRSHAISSLVGVDALALIPAEASDLAAGVEVEFEIINEGHLDF